MAARRLCRVALDFVLPPSCLGCAGPLDRPGALCPACWGDMQFLGEPCCACCGHPFVLAPDGATCAGCLARPPAFDRARAVAAYGGTMRRLILAFKHGDRLDLCRGLATLMIGADAAGLAQATLVVPVPLHDRRLLHRRYNQAAELARAIGQRAGRRVCVDLLRRTKATRSQGGLGRRGRLDNVAGAFAVARPAQAKDAHVLLIDDVMTTGATAEACARALKAAGTRSVAVLTLARVVRADSP